MAPHNNIFLPSRGLGYVSNHIPVQVRYIKSRKENLIVTCVGKSFHTYGISHFGLLSVSGLHPDDILCLASDTYHVYTACGNIAYAWRRGTELKHKYVGHKKPIHTILPFGVHLITIDEESKVRIWDIKDETLYLELVFDHETFHITSALHPSTYINKILFASEAGTMQLWNINKGKVIHTFKGWKVAITCLQQAPALDVVAIGLLSGKIILHNLKFDESIMEFTQDWGLVASISFRTDGVPLMATGSVSGHVVFWNLEERKVASQLLSAHDSAVTGMICLPNEPLFLTSSPDNTLKLWIFDKIDGGARLLRLREGHSAPPTYIRFHGANGDNVLSAATDSTLRIFNTKTEQFNKSMGKASYNRKFSKKRGRLVEDNLKMPPVTHFTSETQREKEWDNIAAIHLGLSMVTTWSYDKVKMGELKLLPERFQKKNLEPNSTVYAICLCLTHCGHFVIIGYNTGHVDRFNMQSGLWRDCYGKPKAHESNVRGVATDSLNQLTVTGSSTGEVKFWRFKNKGTPPFTQLSLDESINFFRTHHETSMLAAALEDFTIAIIDIDTKRVVRKFIGHTAQITDATFSPDCRWLITSSMDCSIKTWDIPSGQLINQFAVNAACISLDMSPTGEILATAHVDYLGIFLWTNRTLYSKVSLKAISPTDEAQLIPLPESVTEAEEINIYDLDDDGEEAEHYESPEQINKLITLSGLSTSRWQNLLNLDVIKKRNKPKMPPKALKAAPFFLPTIPSLNFQFDLQHNSTQSTSRHIVPDIIINLTDLGKLLDITKETDDFQPVIDKLKSCGPSLIDFEINSLAPEGGGTIQIMLQFLKCIQYMFKSKRDFELAEAYLSVFLRVHGRFCASQDVLRNYLPKIQTCHRVAWEKLQKKLLYSISVVQSLKTM